MKLIRELYDYREMICSLVKRDLRGRYKGSVLGFLWTFLNPLFQLIVYTVAFSVIMRMPYEKYYLFLFTALVPWIFFNSSVYGGAACISAQKDMVNKIYFPREVLPISHVICQLVNLLFSFVVVFLALIVTHHGVDLKAIAFLPVAIIIEVLIALGFTLVSSSVTVYFRDLEYVLSILIMAWQFLSPVMYGEDMVPDRFKMVFKLNPMTSVLSMYREILYYKQIPSFEQIAYSAVFGLASFTIGLIVFENLKKHFSEEM